MFSEKDAIELVGCQKFGSVKSSTWLGPIVKIELTNKEVFIGRFMEELEPSTDILSTDGETSIMNNPGGTMFYFGHAEVVLTPVEPN